MERFGKLQGPAAPTLIEVRWLGYIGVSSGRLVTPKHVTDGALQVGLRDAFLPNVPSGHGVDVEFVARGREDDGPEVR